ncbi:MAG: glutamyl-tRNA reductase [Fastidiosipilaceae bacterium]|jgi:glutamyl-tRNA reductase
MTVFVTGINYHSAPLWLRSAMALSDEETGALMRRATDERGIEECVIVNTCNRLEVYFTAPDQKAIRAIQDLLSVENDLDPQNTRKYFYFYGDLQAVKHLIMVACGLDSMVMGETEILGQIKKAHEVARLNGTARTVLNTLFRDSVTAAKKIKTAVSGPAAPVSIASLAAKRALSFCDRPKILLVGATGQTGANVLKNLCSASNRTILATTRTRKMLYSSDMLYRHPDLTYINYDDRFKALSEVDVVITATSSPHYVFTVRDATPFIDKDREYLFLDLAVPLDVDTGLSEFANVVIEDIDQFRHLSARNNRLRSKQNKAALARIDDYVDRFAKWQIFAQGHDMICELDQRLRLAGRRMETTDVVHNLIFNVREHASPEEFEVFMRCLSPQIQQRYFPNVTQQNKNERA